MDPATHPEPSAGAHLPGYALSLYNLSNRLAEAGQWSEALDAVRRAVKVYEQLAKTNPTEFEPELARSLANLGRWLQESGDPVGSVEPIVRARTLLEKNHRWDLAEAIGVMLREAHSSKPRAVAAEYKRLTRQPWPWA